MSSVIARVKRSRTSWTSASVTVKRIQIKVQLPHCEMRNTGNFFSTRSHGTARGCPRRVGATDASQKPAKLAGRNGKWPMALGNSPTSMTAECLSRTWTGTVTPPLSTQLRTCQYGVPCMIQVHANLTRSTHCGKATELKLLHSLKNKMAEITHRQSDRTTTIPLLLANASTFPKILWVYHMEP